MNLYYSASKNMFYDGDLEDAYIAGSGWPDDLLPVDEDVFTEFVQFQKDGKIRIAGKNGLPAWGDIPEPTHEELVAAAEAEKQSRISQANDYMNSKQWPGKAAVGRLKGDELAQYNLWLDYLDELESVKASEAPNTKWPDKPE